MQINIKSSLLNIYNYLLNHFITFLSVLKHLFAVVI